MTKRLTYTSALLLALAGCTAATDDGEPDEAQQESPDDSAGSPGADGGGDDAEPDAGIAKPAVSIDPSPGGHALKPTAHVPRLPE